MNITPYFEVNGRTYEIKKTRWLLVEYEKLRERFRLTEEESEQAAKSATLLADAAKYQKKAQEMWDALCEDPTEENERKYMLFKGMETRARDEYLSYSAKTNAVLKAIKNSVDLLERVVIKSLAEQYFDFDEAKATSVWGDFVETFDTHDDVAEWLEAMAECIFGKDDAEETEAEGKGFLAQMRKRKEEQEAQRKSAIRTN